MKKILSTLLTALLGLGLAAHTALGTEPGTTVLKPAVEAEILDVNPDRLVRLIGAVDGGVLEQAGQLLDLAEKSKAPIYLMINSPGGSVAIGEMFIDAMQAVKSRGIEINCFSSVYSASMAFTILTNCSQAYALESTRLLFHPARVGLRGYYLEGELSEMAASLAKINSNLLEFLQVKLGIDRDLLEKHFHKETFWKASDLRAVTTTNWLKLVKDIRGVTKLYQYR